LADKEESTMKLDVTCMPYLSKDDYRVLTAVEMGMRNHEMVPVSLIHSIAGLRHGGSYRILATLLRYKLVAHTMKEYDGYRLSYLGYDILALRALQARGVIATVGNQIGVGKESDIFQAADADGNEVIVKIHRLGRTSFRAVRKSRDYLLGKSKASWLYMSRLSAMKEFAFMRALYAHGFPVPIPIDQSRHIVVMSRVPGFPLAQIRSGKLEFADRIFAACLDILRKLAEHGLVHCDFNEFNLMIDQEEGGNITLIDFPQMVSTSHYNASELLQRDINGLVKFFAMKMKYVPPDDALFTLEQLLQNSVNAVRIDEEIQASGFEGFDDVDINEINLLVANGLSLTGNDEEEEEVDDDEEEGEDSDAEQDDVAEEAEEIVENNGEETEAKTSKVRTKKDAAVAVRKDGEKESEGEEEEDESNEEALEAWGPRKKKSTIKKKKSSATTSTSAKQRGDGVDSDLSDEEKPSNEERMSEAYAKLRSEILRKGKGRAGRGGGGGGASRGSRNNTKKRNKFGRIVREDHFGDW
jgi:RIO kinase 2